MCSKLLLDKSDKNVTQISLSQEKMRGKEGRKEGKTEEGRKEKVSSLN